MALDQRQGRIDVKTERAVVDETPANMELLRLALPRRVFTLSQVKYAVDCVAWLYENQGRYSE